MTLNQLIKALQELQDSHGKNIDVGMWEYNGGDDALRDVLPMYDVHRRIVVIHGDGDHWSRATR